MVDSNLMPTHSSSFRLRRLCNWLPLGLTYMFLYMGRYNLTVAKNALGENLFTKDDFGFIFGLGAVAYGCSFVINGPLTDRLGGRFAILVSSCGSAIMNALLGLATIFLIRSNGTAFPIVPVYALLYALNMYFQSFGAVAIVKVNSHWFHVRERGKFGAIFGCLISMGIYLAFDVGRSITDGADPGVAPEKLGLLGTLVRNLVAPTVAEGRETWWVFFIPSIMLFTFFLIDLFLVRNRPTEAGQEDFHLGDATAGDSGPALPVIQIFRRMLTNPIILTIAGIEFCSGVFRNGVMHWFPIYAKEVKGQGIEIFVYEHWGAMLCVAGILGGICAGLISDLVFRSRRGPVACLLYASMGILTLLSIFLLKDYNALGWAMAGSSLCVIGVHGMLSGTATADFGGSRNAGTAVGIIDGFVYLGTGFQSITLGKMLDKGSLNWGWSWWPPFLLVFTVIGFLFTLKILKAYPQNHKDKASAEATGD